MKRALRSIFTAKKPKAQLIRVTSITQGGTHCWCESDCGNVRKPISSVPKDLMDEYRNAEGSFV